MRSALVALSVLLGAVSVSLAAPLVPTIVGHDINFGAEFEYKTNGLGPDTLTTTKEWLGEEATAYWPNWPGTAGVTPIWFNIPGGPTVFGGDLQLDVQLFGEDAMPPHLDVSMVGTGGNAPGIADLEVWGYIAPAPNPAAVNVLLWAIDLDAVSLYGYKDDVAYVLEGEGTILDCLLARENGLLGQPGVMRGNIDLDLSLDGVTPGFPAHYHPLQYYEEVAGPGSYSGETGLSIPEPATLSLLGAGVVVLISRRRRG